MPAVRLCAFPILVALVAAGLIGCGTVEHRPEIPAESDSLGSIPPVARDSAASLLSRLNALPMAEPDTGCPAYDPDDYSYASSLEYHLVLHYDGVYDPYNDRWYDSLDSLSVLDIEHIVARKEAHVSGLCRDSLSAKQAFAGDSLNLALARAVTNRLKSDKDAAEWLPESNQCWFAQRVIGVREKYQLTIDPAERDTLAGLINDCSAFDLVTNAVQPPNPLHDESRGCPASPYASCSALRADYPHGVYQTHCAYDRSLDSDRDGWICLGG